MAGPSNATRWRPGPRHTRHWNLALGIGSVRPTQPFSPSTSHQELHVARFSTGRPPTLAPTGMVCSPHSLASAAGVDILRAGGSAVDAAIATSGALSVLYPHMTSI